LEPHDVNAAVWYNVNMERQNYPVRKTTLHEADDDNEYSSLTPHERVTMMWQLVVNAWPFTGAPPFAPRLQRHVVRLVVGEG
jgi:hypothetical protein